MAFWNKKNSTPEQVVKYLTSPDGGHEGMSAEFSSAFRPIKSGDIALPYIEQMTTTAMGAVMFGNDNLFPQLIDQMYYASVLNGSILDFKQLCTIGAGYTFEGYDQMPTSKKMDIYRFISQVGLDDLVENIAFDLFTHERSNVKIIFDDRGKPQKVEYVRAQKVRKTNSLDYVLSADWTWQRNTHFVHKYDKFKRNSVQILEETKLGNSDIYAIPRYCSANNWMALEYESSILHKQNIYEGIFPSYMLAFPKIPTKQEKEDLKKTIEAAKGARNSSKILTFFAANKDRMPELSAVPQIQTDKIFLQTDERTDSKICQAHIIDPLIMGIRVSGKLGSGTDIEKAVGIFQRVNVVPKKRQVEQMINKLLYIFDLGDVKFKLNDFSIIDAVKEVNATM